MRDGMAYLDKPSGSISFAKYLKSCSSHSEMPKQSLSLETEWFGIITWQNCLSHCFQQVGLSKSKKTSRLLRFVSALRDSLQITLIYYRLYENYYIIVVSLAIIYYPIIVCSNLPFLNDIYHKFIRK